MENKLQTTCLILITAVIIICGITYQQSIPKIETSNWDSDSDGISDSEDVNPAGGGRYIPQNFEWEYDGKTWKRIYSIHEDWYEYYKNKPRISHGLEYVTENDPFIKEIAISLKKTAEKKGYSPVLFIMSFVQGISYVEDFYTSFDDYPKYPVETLIERNGDCEDTSYLFTSLVNALGYDSVLVELLGHTAIAISTSEATGEYYYELGDDKYYFFETTGKGWELGEMFSKDIYEQAKITRVWDSSVHYLHPQNKKP